MDLNTLASKLRAQAKADSRIVLDQSIFEDEKVRAGIRSAFSLAEDTNLTINVKDSDIRDPTTEGVLTISTATASVLKQTELPVQLTFIAAAGGALQAIITFEMVSSWKFSDSFKGLDIFPFKSLEISGAHFVYATARQSHFAWPGPEAQAIDLEPGLNFLSKVKILSSVLNLIKPVIGEVNLSLNMWGPFAPAAGEALPVGKLRGPLSSAGPFSVGVDPFKLALSNPALAVQIGKSSADFPLQPIDLLVEAQFQKLNVAVAIPLDGSALEISTTPLPNDPSINALIGSLPGGQIFADFTTHLPAELSDVFTNVKLNNLAMRVTPKPSVSYVRLSVGTGNQWNVMRGLTLEALRLEIRMMEPTGITWTRVHIEAVAEFLKEIFPGKLNFVAEIEKQASWRLKTVRGAYYGTVNLGTIVGKLIGESLVPPALKDITFSDFGINATKEGGAFNYTVYGNADTSFPIFDQQLTSALTLVVRQTANGHAIDFGGNVIIGRQVFSISLKLGDSDAKLKGTWKQEGAPLQFGDIASAFGWDSMPSLPEGLDLALTDAEFNYDFNKEVVVLTAHSANYGQIVFASQKKDGNRVYVFSVDVPVDLKFTKLPLVGESLRTDKPVGIDRLQIAVASAALSEQDVIALSKLLAKKPDETPLIPKLLTAGVTIAAQLQMNGPHEIVLPLTRSAPKEEPLLLGEGDGKPADEIVSVEAPPALLKADQQTEPKWFNLQKTLGPVHFEKVGVQYQDSQLRFLLNAALSAAGLTISVEGLSIGSSLKKFEPKAGLRGLGIEYKNDAVEIGGAFVGAIIDGKPHYNGAAVIKTKQFAVSALGSYTELDTQPSLFIYAFLDYPLGGPAFFFVTGLAAGFGYNRRLIAPSIDDVAKFPLITQARGPKQDAPKDVMTALTSLQQYVPPTAGSIFLAVGVKFNSFKLVDSFALLTLEFGNNFAINLIGVSKAVVPTPETGKTITPLAQVEIVWKATFNPDDGCLAIDARLTPNSYILSKDCRLTGGYAFYSWFSGPHAGDFVQTLGGYHPEFAVPAHYPKVPRLAFDWRVSSSLTIQGEAYYALTGSALMAGGRLEVLFREGELRAWLKVGANFLIAWKPYHYDASLYVNVGASYTFNIDLLFTSVRVTISIDVGAQLHLWGPDFSGTARIDLSVISFTIAFGAGASQTPPPLKTWSTFQESFLPAKDVCSISVKDGLVRNIQAGGKERWVINPKELSLVVDSAVPFKFAPTAGGSLSKVANVDFGVGPMAVSKDKLESTFTVTVRKGDDSVDDKFKHSLIKKLVPAGLWGETANPKADSKRFLENVPSGIEITPRDQPKAGQTSKINLKVFDYSNAFYPVGKEQPKGHAYEWQPASAFNPSPQVEALPTVEEIRQARLAQIRKTVVSNQRRAALLAGLGMTFAVSIDGNVADEFLSAPQVGTVNLWQPK